jgi:hypothetical protein
MLAIKNKVILVRKGEMASGWLCTEPALMPTFKWYFYKVIVFVHEILFLIVKINNK